MQENTEGTHYPNVRPEIPQENKWHTISGKPSGEPRTSTRHFQVIRPHGKTSIQDANLLETRLTKNDGGFISP